MTEYFVVGLVVAKIGAKCVKAMCISFFAIWRSVSNCFCVVAFNGPHVRVFGVVAIICLSVCRLVVGCNGVCGAIVLRTCV